MYLILQVTEEDADELAGVGLGVGEEEVPRDEVAEPAKVPAKNLEGKLGSRRKDTLLQRLPITRTSILRSSILYGAHRRNPW